MIEVENEYGALMHNFIRGDQNRAKRGKSWALSRWQETKGPNERKKKASDCQESGCSLVIALIEVILKH